MNYRERLRAHLVKYKFRVLGVRANAAWKGPRTGVLAEQPHLLPAEHLRLNILAPYRERFWAEFEAGRAERRSLELHRDFAHLNSSQAMCFNLFYPLVVDRGWAGAFVQQVLGLKDAAPRTLAFEYVEDPQENTHFGFFAQLDSGAKLYFETRLAELGFGTAELGARHREKLASVYAPRLAPLVDAKWLEPEAFYRRYQLMRNLCYLDRPANLLFLVVPKASESLQQALQVLPEITAGALNGRVRVLYLEDLMERLKTLLRGRDELLKAHYREFRDKYLLE